MNRYSFVFFGIIIISFSACKTQLPTTNAIVAGKIKTALGPEDFVLDTFNGNKRLIVSCSGRRKDEPKTGAFYTYDFATSISQEIKRYNEPKDFVCYPHGVDIVAHSDGKIMLYAVNHQKAEKEKTIHSVVQYEVKNDSLIFLNNFVSHLIVSPNDVAAMPDGSFYVTNDSKHTGGIGLLLEKLFQTKRSTIIYKNAENDFLVATQKLPYANGLAIKGNKVYISCTFKSILNEYEKMPDGTLKLTKKLSGIKGMDNITFYKDYLVIASHTNFMKFMKHVKSSENKSPGVVSLFHPEKDTVIHIYATDGNDISANSTGLIFNDTLYIAQVFDGFLLKVYSKNLP
jgi:uncharacterized protein YunC (DUF1805 family)